MLFPTTSFVFLQFGFIFFCVSFQLFMQSLGLFLQCMGFFLFCSKERKEVLDLVNAVIVPLAKFSGEGKRRNEFAEWHVAWLAE